jgi:hypothetical protein
VGKLQARLQHPLRKMHMGETIALFIEKLRLTSMFFAEVRFCGGILFPEVT